MIMHDIISKNPHIAFITLGKIKPNALFFAQSLNKMSIIFIVLGNIFANRIGTGKQKTEIIVHITVFAQQRSNDVGNVLILK